MAQPDYVGRKRTRHQKSPKRRTKRVQAASALMIALAVALLLTFASGLWWLTKEKKTQQKRPSTRLPTAETLPPKPEERWKYIKELENRQLSTQHSNKLTAKNDAPPALSAEQQQILSQLQSDMRQTPALQERTWHEQTLTQRHTTATNLAPAPSPSFNSLESVPKAPAAKPDTRATERKRDSTSWTIQCGSFKNVAQAERVRAQLALSGFESRIAISSGWHRVLVGPYFLRAKADAQLKRLQTGSYKDCILVQPGG